MILSGNRSTYINIGDKDYLFFGGTNYLGLAQRAELLQVVQKSFADFGFSSGASRLTSGENEILLSLESELAEFGQAQSAVTLPAGFLSNQAVLEGIEDEVDICIISKRAHTSIKSAVKKTRKEVIEVEELYAAELSLRHDFSISPDQNVAVFCEPIDALTGLPNRIDHLANRAWAQDYIVIDEAQSFGVLGNSGRGALEHFKLARGQNLIRTGTFSKALGTYGGFILAAEQVIDLIKSKSEAYRGSTSLPPLLCAASRESLRLIQREPKATLIKLRENIKLLNELLDEANLLSLKAQLPNPKEAQCTPIYYLLAFDDVSNKRLELFDKMICIPSMSNYFLGTREIGLRFTVQSGHTREDLQRLVKSLAAGSS